MTINIKDVVFGCFFGTIICYYRCLLRGLRCIVCQDGTLLHFALSQFCLEQLRPWTIVYLAGISEFPRSSALQAHSLVCASEKKKPSNRGALRYERGIAASLYFILYF